MKKIYSLIIFIAVSISMVAQNIGIGTNTPNTSAMLEIKASDKGLLIPRTSTTSRNAIVNPAKGLMIYDSTTSNFWFYNGGAWMQMGASGNGWSVTGNAGTIPGTNFFGTTDAQPLTFKVNNVKAGYIDFDNLKGNTSFGYLGLSSNTTGTANTANGMYGLYLNTTGSQNTATGFASLYSNVSGTYNSAHGAGALNNNTGNWNTAAGAYSMYYNITGGHNTATGGYALQNNLSGGNNVANGYGAMNNNTTGHSNVAIGIFALSKNTGGNNLVAIGDSALFNNGIGAVLDISASANTAIGSKALYSNTTGSYNTANGYSALYSNTGGNYNTANGYRALEDNTIGSGNTVNGYYALSSNTIGGGNTALGMFALAANASGDNNTALGLYALSRNFFGDNNLAIGSNADVAADDLNGAAAIGYAARTNANDKIVIGTVSNSGLTGGYGTWQSFSDGGFKENVLANVPGLAFINKLNPVTYRLNAEKINEFLGINQQMDSSKDSIEKTRYFQRLKEVSAKLHTGFIAQEVEATAKSIGYDFDGVHHPETDKDNYTIGYASFVAPLVKAVQEQQQMIEDLKRQISAQEKINATLIARLTILESALTAKK